MDIDMIDYTNDLLSLKDINERCEAHIIASFTIGKQMTVDRIGSEEEKAAMYDFIDRCRSWANSESPKVSDLYELQP